MKKQLFVLIPSIFFAVSCTPPNQPKPVKVSCTHKDSNHDSFCDLCGLPVDPHVHTLGDDINGDGKCDACGIEIEGAGDYELCEEGDTCEQESGFNVLKPDPSYPFYLTVGSKKRVDAQTQSTHIEEQKEYIWKNNSPENISYEQYDSKAQDKVEITGLKATGINNFATLRATNGTNSDMKCLFGIRVVDFNPEDQYLWEYTKEDRKQFGYDSKDESKKRGTLSGTARLGSLDWEYTRNQTNSINTGYGGVAFGKLTAPENVTLVNKNTRKVKSITIEHGSSKSLGQMTLKIGDNIINTVTSKKPSFPSQSSPIYEMNKQVLEATTFDCGSATGDISISFKTDAYDPTRAEDPTYYVPGATYLKSIFITYVEEEVNSIEMSPNSKHQTVYAKWDNFKKEDLASTLIINKITDSGVYPISFDSLEISDPVKANEDDTERTVNISFTKGDKTFIISYKIYLVSSIELDSSLNFPDKTKYVELSKFKSAGVVVWGYNKDKTNRYDLTNKLTWYDSTTFKPAEAKGNESLQVETTGVVGCFAGKPEIGYVEVGIDKVYPITSIVLNEKKSTPKYTEYFEGEKFTSTNIEVLGYCQDSSIDPVDIHSSMTWYDGSSFDLGTLTEHLTPNSTYVYGVYKDFAPVKIEGITVTPAKEFVADTSSLLHTKYVEGATFNPEGIKILSYKNDEKTETIDVTSLVTVDWYDGASYEAHQSDDKVALSKKLTLETTKVIGYVKAFDLTVSVDVTVLPIERLELGEETSLNTTIFGVSEEFKYGGTVIYGYSSDPDAVKAKIDNTSFNFYDGTSYEAHQSDDKVALSKKLALGTTSIYAVMKNKDVNAVKIEGIEVYDYTAVEVTGTLTNSTYYEGNYFDCSGLTITLVIGDNKATRDITTAVVWNEGNSLNAGQTSVVGKYSTASKKEFILEPIEINEVIIASSTFSLCKNLDDIASGSKVLITSKENGAYLDGTQGSNMKSATAAITAANLVTSDTVEFSKAVENSMLTLTKIDSGYTLMCNGGQYWGVSNSGGTSCAKTPNNKVFLINMDQNGCLTLSITFTDSSLNQITKYFGYGVIDTKNNKYGFGLFDENPANVQFYTLVN